MKQLTYDCTPILLKKLLDINTKQTPCKKTWDVLESTRLKDFKCPRWRAQLKLVKAPPSIRVWLPNLSPHIFKQYKEIFETRPNLIRPWNSQLQHVYGAITHQFSSIYSVEGKHGARLIVYQDRDDKTLTTFWPLFYFSQGHDQHVFYALKLDYLETRWATIDPSYAAQQHKPSTKPHQPCIDSSCMCQNCQASKCCCHVGQPHHCHLHQARKCNCHCQKSHSDHQSSPYHAMCTNHNHAHEVECGLECRKKKLQKCVEWVE